MNKLMLAALAAMVMQTSFGELSDATVGFYTFNDDEPGTVIYEAANSYPDGAMGAATVGIGNGGKTAISAERPGKYIFEGPGPYESQLVCTEPQSLRLGEGTWSSSNSSGVLYFGDAAKALSPGHAGAGYTYEFFFKADSAHSWEYQLVADLGYWLVSEGMFYPIRITMPYPDGSSSCYFRAGLKGYEGGPYNGSSINVSNKVPGFSGFNDGKWHHFAQIETVSAEGVPTVSYYVDHVYLTSTVFNDKAVVEALKTEVGSPYGNPLSQGKRVVIGCNNSWNAAISCVRFSNRALTVDELLYASDSALFTDDTIAYYGFDDGEVGASAVNTASIHNLMAPEKFAGSVSTKLNTDGDNNPTARYDAEGPGNFLYHGYRNPGMTPLIVSPKSLNIDSEKSTSASVTFAGLATELSKCHQTGSTLEFFIKFKGENVLEWDPIIYYFPGYRVNGEEKDFRVCLPLANTADYANKVIYSLGVQDYDKQKCTGTLPSCPVADGKWHHVAIVETPGENGAATVSVWVDYVRYGEHAVESTFEKTSASSLELGRYRNRAKYACLRVTGRPLDKYEFLHAYESLPQGVLIKLK